MDVLVERRYTLGDPVILGVDDDLASPSLPGFLVPVGDLVVVPTDTP